MKAIVLAFALTGCGGGVAEPVQWLRPQVDGSVCLQVQPGGDYRDDLLFRPDGSVYATAPTEDSCATLLP